MKIIILIKNTQNLTKTKYILFENILPRHKVLLLDSESTDIANPNHKIFFSLKSNLTFRGSKKQGQEQSTRTKIFMDKL